MQNQRRVGKLAQKNESIKTAYEILQRVSESKEARMAYEARQAEIMDRLTRGKFAREEGIKEGILKEKIAIAKNALLLNLSLEQIHELTDLPVEAIKTLKN